MELQRDFDLTGYNSFAVPGKARFFIAIDSETILVDALDFAAENNLPTIILGAGSNILILEDFPGVVMQMTLPGICVRHLDGDEVLLRAGAGENWHDLVMNCLNNGIYGIENMALIPGTVGAAPIQNIGAYGVELQDFFVSLDAIDINSGAKKTYDRSACQFGYRDSIFKHALRQKVVITSVTLRLSSKAVANSQYEALQAELKLNGLEATTDPMQIAKTVMTIRRRKLPNPIELPNAGSFFKNPVISQLQYEMLQEEYTDVPGFRLPGTESMLKIPAAWLLEKAGWKGFRRGAVGVHAHQAVVLVNYGGASGTDVWNLARELQESIVEMFAIELEPEVQIFQVP